MLSSTSCCRRSMLAKRFSMASRRGMTPTSRISALVTMPAHKQVQRPARAAGGLSGASQAATCAEAADRCADSSSLAADGIGSNPGRRVAWLLEVVGSPAVVGVRRNPALLIGRGPAAAVTGAT